MALQSLLYVLSEKSFIMTRAGVFTLTSDAASLLLALIFSIRIFSSGLGRRSSSSVKNLLMFACFTSGLVQSPRLSFLWTCIIFIYSGAGWFDLKHAEIPRLWPASTLMSPFSAADKFLCESHHLFSCRRHSPRLLICRPARRANWAHYPFGRGIFRHLLHLLCALTASVPRYSSVLSSHFQISSSTTPDTTPFFSSLQHQQPPPLRTTSP